MSNRLRRNLWKTAKKRFPISKDTPIELIDKIKNKQKRFMAEGI